MNIKRLNLNQENSNDINNKNKIKISKFIDAQTNTKYFKYILYIFRPKYKGIIKNY